LKDSSRDIWRAFLAVPVGVLPRSLSELNRLVADLIGVELVLAELLLVEAGELLGRSLYSSAVPFILFTDLWGMGENTCFLYKYALKLVGYGC
jgi:hypothetical protein